jgi:DNA-binding winged helix-turn-helix (wHTH) protein/Tol biopolymer transport system component
VSSAPPTQHPFRFSSFEADPQSGELRKNGVRLRIQDQPFQVLLKLLERPGQVVTREELKTALWSADTFVDFDNGLNMAVKRLREVLADDADHPRFIETLPRRGYRFIAAVPSSNLAIEAPQPSSPQRGLTSGIQRRVVLALLLCLFVAAGIVAWISVRSPLPIPRVVDSAQITKDGRLKEASTYRLVSDGERLYFQEGAFTQSEQNIELVQVGTQGGETIRMPVPLRNPVAFDVSEKNLELLLGAGDFSLTVDERPLWALPLPGGPPHRLGDVIAHDAAWAPDGRYLAFAYGKDIFVAQPDGSQVRKLITVNDFDTTYFIQFSPDGERLRFTATKFSRPGIEPDQTNILEAAADGTRLRRLPIEGGFGRWSPDGNYYFYQKGRDVWVLPERHSLFGKVVLQDAVQLTSGPIAYDPPTPSADGKGLFVIGHQSRGELVHHSNDTKQWEPFLGGISAAEPEVSPDGRWVAYTTFPDSNLWRSKLDGSERLQLTFAPINPHEPRWSPDGTQILFTDFPNKILVVSANGGAPRRLVPADRSDFIGAGAWFPDGKSIIFGRLIGCPLDDFSCFSIYRLDLTTQQESKIAGSDRMVGARLSHDGRYLTAMPLDQNKGTVMLYDFQAQRWTKLANVSGSVAWSHDSRAIVLRVKEGNQPAELIRISVPDGRVAHVLNLKDLTLGGIFNDWVSLLPDDSPLLMLDRSTEEIYRLDLQYH